jgi:ABC-2 family transporter protein
MIWMVLRRYRLLFALMFVLVVALVIWMYLLGRAFDAAVASAACHRSTFGCDVYTNLNKQAIALNIMLLFVPCLFGIVFGAPLVAGEFDQHTNRLAWTQGISRTKWLVSKWFTVLVVLVLLATLLTLVAQWWVGRTYEQLPFQLVETVGVGQVGHIQPQFFPVTGLAPIGYTAFAFSLGVASGVVVRKVSWAIAGTVVIYAVVALLMVTVIRPNLAPQVFVASSGQPGAGPAAPAEVRLGAWNLGTVYVYTPGASNITNRPSAQTVAQHCETYPYDARYFDCLEVHGIEQGTYFQPSTHYWELQWWESAILVGSSALLLGVAIAGVRRWRA